MKELRALAEACRQRIEKAAQGSDHESFREFPRGSCGDTSDIVARYLTEVHGIPSEVAHGWNNSGETHAWVVAGETSVDITADQMGMPAIMVFDDSDWHKQWNAERRPYYTPKNWQGYPWAIWHALVEGA